MAKTALSQLKNWFLNGMKPPQEHFWNWLDSFWHKDDLIPMENIEDLSEALGGKSDIDHSHAGYMVKNAENVVTDDWSVSSEGDVSKIEVSIEDSTFLQVKTEVGSLKKSRILIGHTNVKIYQTEGDNPEEHRGNLLLSVNGVRNTKADGIELKDEHIPLSDDYPELELTDENSLKDFNDSILAKTLTETTIIPLTAHNEAIINTEEYSGISYFPYKSEIVAITAVATAPPVGDEGIGLIINKSIYDGADNKLIIEDGQKASENIHGLVGSTLEKGDSLRFLAFSENGSTGVQIILTTKRLPE